MNATSTKLATICLKRWFAGSLKKEFQATVFFRRLDVMEVHAVTPRAVQVTFGFSKDVAQDCNICGRVLETEVSRATGIGPTCCKHLGIERKSQTDATAILMALEATVAAFGTRKCWIPKSQFEVTDGSVDAHAPAPVAKAPVAMVALAANQIQIAAWLATKNNIPAVLTVVSKLKSTAKWVLVQTVEAGKQGIPTSQIVQGKV